MCRVNPTLSARQRPNPICPMKIRSKLYLSAILVFALLMLLFGLILVMIGQ